MLKARPANRSETTPRSPGGLTSPQRPGMTPDRSTIPGHYFVQAPAPLGPPVRPGSQYLTAEALSHLIPVLDEKAVAADFEQAPSSDAERAKILPWHTPPRRPTPWFTLGDTRSEEDPALLSGPAALALAQETLPPE